MWGASSTNFKEQYVDVYLDDQKTSKNLLSLDRYLTSQTNDTKRHCLEIEPAKFAIQALGWSLKLGYEGDRLSGRYLLELNGTLVGELQEAVEEVD